MGKGRSALAPVLRQATVTAVAAPKEPEPTSSTEDFERPAFAERFPRHPELDALVRAFEEGDYARVRVEAPKLAERVEDAAVAEAARELRKRLDPDPLAYVLFGLTTALLVFLVGWFYWHQH